MVDDGIGPAHSSCAILWLCLLLISCPYSRVGLVERVDGGDAEGISIKNALALFDNG